MTDKPDPAKRTQTRLEDGLREIARDGGSIDISQFEFVGFDEIARAYGERWSVHKERVKRTAHEFLKRRLGERDLLVRADDGFLIVYAKRDADRARSQGEALKDDLNTFYLGEGATRPTVEVDVKHERIPVQELVQSLGDLDFDTAAPAAGRDDPLAGIDWKYQPVWDAQREAIFSYYVAPVLAETGKRVPGYQFDMDLQRQFDFVAIDEAGLSRSEIALRKMISDGRRCQFGASIHSSSLAGMQNRNRLFGVIDRFDKDLMRYRIMQIGATPPGMPRIYLEEIYRGLKARAPKIAISLAWNESDIRSVIQMKPAAIGFTLSPWALDMDGSVTRSELLAKVRQAAGAVRDAKIPFYFDGYVSSDLVAKLRDAGVDVISSPDVWPLADTPQAAHLWPSDRLAA